MLKLENVSKYYYSSSSVTCALRKINLELNIGEFVSITGESGSGKTTLLNILSGLDSYEDGEMYYYNKKTSFFDDEDWENYRRDEIAFIFQNYNLIDSFTVIENVIVTYIIEGYSYSEAKEKSKEILKLVGLENDGHKKATKLSGGQKQRLAIARALAKETNIIVADEPTGNLDVENGKAILELLKKVSKDKLVIVVTHNYGQIEPFITRKIRLHDGEIVLDEKINDYEKSNITPIEKENTASVFKRVFNFSFLNIKSQPKKSILLLMLVIVLTISSFVFYANFKTNLDDNKTKELVNDFFLNFDETRLLVRHSESMIITDEILENANVDKVVSVEKYDAITDCNYYRNGRDYKYFLGGGLSEPDLSGNVHFIDSSSIQLLNDNQFMRSGSSLTENMLSEGRLPSNNLEMVVYSDDSSLLNTTELVLFKNSRKWGDDAFYKYNVTIVGLLKEPTQQAYFSDDLCKMMQLSSYNFSVGLKYKYNSYKYNELKYSKVAIDYNLKDYDISLSLGKKNSLSNSSYEVNLADNFSYYINNSLEKSTYKVDLENHQTICDDAIGVTEEVFNKIYNDLVKELQFVVFIEDYANTDDVTDLLAKQGLVSLSCFRASTAGYDYGKVVMRYVNLVISLVALLILSCVTILLGYSILKVKKNDYVIFKMIGLSNSLIKKINIIELLLYGIIANIVLVVTYIIVKNTTTSTMLLDSFKYIKFYDFLIILAITLITMFVLANRFNKFITKKFKITVLKED